MLIFFQNNIFENYKSIKIIVMSCYSIMFVAVAAILVGFGLFAMFKPQLYTQSTVGSILNPGLCNMKDCSMQVKYIVGGQSYEKWFAKESMNDFKGKSTITVYYNPHDPINSAIYRLPWKVVGGICLLGGLCLFACGANILKC